MSDKYTDAQMVDYINRIRKAHIEDLKLHPLDSVAEFLRQHSNRQQLKRLYGCVDPQQAAGRACHGDAFRIKD